MPLISPPGNTAVDLQGRDGKVTNVEQGWRNFFSAVFNICNALTMSGTTANRPSAGLWTGRMYFDTTLGKPIWYKTVGWVDATGAPA